MNNKNTKNVIGMIGLGTMGSNLLQNLADQGYACSGYDINQSQVNHLNTLNPEMIYGFTNLDEFINSLQSPRVVIILVPAGDPVDQVLEQLEGRLDSGDIIIDAGNSHFTDTERRCEELNKKEIRFIGMGVSGGEEGARKGPSLMPGGDKNAYQEIAPILKKIAAQVDGEPMVDYIGKRSAGHFVKMVHNGIEYAIMQLISEAFAVLKKGLGFGDVEIHDVFKKWNEGRLESYLIEITRDIFAYKNPKGKDLLLNNIRDQAKAKGTGKWTSQAAMDLQLPVPIIDIAVAMRDLSIFKDLRIKASKVYPDPKHQKTHHAEEDYSDALEAAFYFGMVSAYAQGMHLFSRASEEFDYELENHTIAGIWRGGCIIRSRFLNDIYKAFKNNSKLEHLFLDKDIQKSMEESLPAIRKVVSQTALQGIATPAFSAALNYFDNFRAENMPTNLIQAQRDYFGSHTYELKGKKGVFHSKWIMENPNEKQAQN